MEIFTQKLPKEDIVIFKQEKRYCTKCNKRLSIFNKDEQCFYHLQETIRDLEDLSAEEVLAIKLNLSWIDPVKTGVL